MRPIDSASAGLILGIVVAVVDLLLLIWLVRDRLTRTDTLSEEDRRHFTSQDLRRGVVVLVLMVLAVSLAWGSRIPPVVAGRPNRLFLQVWLATIGLIFLLVALAFFDWFATRFYARRRRLELLEEGVSLIEAEKRARQRSTSGSNGHHGTNGVP